MIRLLHARLGRRLTLLRRSADRGVALITVIALGAVLLLLSATMVAVAVSGTTSARTDSDWNAAIAAAYAGVEDYQSKLANDNTYTQYGSAATQFSKTSTFTGTASNPAFGVGTSGTWAPVGESKTSSYRYEVDNSAYSTSGVLRLRSTGRVGQTTRTVVADLKQAGFIDFLYFTDYEVSDPQLTGSSCTPAYAWAVAARPGCTSIQFGSADVFDGPVHSNDTLVICGATFNGVVTSSKTDTPRYSTPDGCGTPGFAVAGSPAYAKNVPMPATNSKLLQETRSDIPTTVPRPGCLYTGPTTITFNADGTMTVYSPWTRATNTKNDPATAGSAAPGCGTPGTTAGGGTLGSPGGQTLPVVANNLIYVQDVPAATSDPNWSKDLPKQYSCTSAEGARAGNGVGFPAAGETPPSTSGDTTSYSCTKGDVFVKGVVKGNVTVAAANYVYVTGDLTYADAAKDMLGLVGQNAVYVYNPVKSVTTVENYTDTCYYWYGGAYRCTKQREVTVSQLLDRSKSDRVIQAAILSVAHTFTVQNYNQDSGYTKGKLRITGAIAQKFRGPVATTSGGVLVTGYAKAYSYDARMAFMAPPKFLSPVSTSYGINQLVESKTAVTPSGAEIR